MPDADQYTDQLVKLAPEGKAWPTEPESLFYKLLNAISQEFARIDARANELLNQVYPDTTTELLPEWERVAGLPDPCSGIGATVAIRRNDLLAKITARGGQSPQYFIDVAAALGYDITITEFDAFRAGINRAGDHLCNEDWEFSWRVNSTLNTITYFRAGIGSAGEPLAYWSDERLECVIRARKPAHTVVLFSYT